MTRQSSITTISILVLTLFATTTLLSQTDFEKWKKAEAEKYKQWKDERDKAFTEFLKLEWKKFQAFKEQNLYDSPKPKKLPVAPPHPVAQPDLKQKPQPEQKPETKSDKKPEAKTEPKPEAKPDAKVEPKPEPKADKKSDTKPDSKTEIKPESKPETKQEPKPEPKPEVKPEIKPDLSTAVDPKKNTSSLSLDFYEATVPLLYDDGLKAGLTGSPNNKTISAFWEAMSKSNYEDFLKQAKLNRERMKLNDWGYCELINKTAERLYPGSRNESNMFDWFMLLKSGYQAKIGYSGNNVYLLLPTSNVLYAVAYYMFGTSDTKYYNVMFDRFEKPQITTLYSYDQNYPDATKLTAYQVTAAPNIQNNIQTRTLKFTHNGSEYTVKVRFDRSAVKFFEYYPQTNLEVYFDATPSTDAMTSLLDALRPLVKDKSETESVDILLHFVQTAFEYKTDDEQFGREKPFFPEETLFYPASDCEDRSVLFSVLVRRLLGLEVVGLDYPNHVATAVHFKGNNQGDQVSYQNKKYTVCDPTYINADFGMCMPQFRNVKPGIIALK